MYRIGTSHVSVPALQAHPDNEQCNNKRNSCTDDKFIMIPTVDVCFKNLMHNAKVRKGFLAALLKVDPETITKF